MFRVGEAIFRSCENWCIWEWFFGASFLKIEKWHF